MRTSPDGFRKGEASAKTVALVLLALVVLCGAWAPLSDAQSPAQIQAQIGQAYAAILGAQKSGGNVSALVLELNSAISLVQQANVVNGTDPARAQSLYSQASTLAQQVMAQAPAVAAAGKASVAASQLDLVVETGVLGALAVVVYLYLPRVYWRIWLGAHRGWRVKRP